MGLHRVIHEMLDLVVVRHIGLHGGVSPQRQLGRERLKPVEPPCPENQFGP